MRCKENGVHLAKSVAKYPRPVSAGVVQVAGSVPCLRSQPWSVVAVEYGVPELYHLMDLIWVCFFRDDLFFVELQVNSKGIQRYARLVSVVASAASVIVD